MRHYSLLDKGLLQIDRATRAVFGDNTPHTRAYPAQNITEPPLEKNERKQAEGIMRINHAGEVCAQALYHGQALTSKNRTTREQLEEAAREEGDHLAWCERRLQELQGHTSRLNPFWYAGSFFIGAATGLLGDQWSLGFVAETETQVIEHLERQCLRLPANDQRSPAILKQMAEDEAHHRATAMAKGATPLPRPIKKIMAFCSKIMVNVAFYV